MSVTSEFLYITMAMKQFVIYSVGKFWNPVNYDGHEINFYFTMSVSSETVHYDGHEINF